MTYVGMGKQVCFLLCLESLVGVEEAVRHDSGENDEADYIVRVSWRQGRPLYYFYIHLYIIDQNRSTAGLSGQSPVRMPTNPIDRPTMEVRPECGPPAGDLRNMGAG